VDFSCVDSSVRELKRSASFPFHTIFVSVSHICSICVCGFPASYCLYSTA
jgi:hypothetical protein